MIDDIITLSRIPFSLLLLVFPVSSPFFAVLYLLCGISDVLDGFLARKLHTESKKGAMLDTTADLIFAVIYAIKILPILSLPFWIWVWTAFIAVLKITVITTASIKKHRLFIEHSTVNKLTGILLFLLPLSVFVIDIKYASSLVCAVATFSAIKELINLHNEDKNDNKN